MKTEHRDIIDRARLAGLPPSYLAHELLERAVRLNPAQAFAWDHYALHKLYTGDPAAALRPWTISGWCRWPVTP